MWIVGNIRTDIINGRGEDFGGKKKKIKILQKIENLFGNCSSQFPNRERYIYSRIYNPDLILLKNAYTGQN